MIRTDGKSWADFQIVEEVLIDFEDGWDLYPLKDETSPYEYDDNKEIIRIYADASEIYMNTVNGVPEDEVFGGIIYAG